MSIIDTQNAKQIRDSMEVYCGMSARSTGVDLTVSLSGDIAAVDSNISTSIDADKWDMRKLTDFCGEGFPLDGSRKLLDTSATGALSSGKIGIRSTIGGDMTITVNATANIPAVTLACTAGEGYAMANGKKYTLRRIVVIPVNAKSVVITIDNTNEKERVEIASITPGISISFSNEELISCILSLRSDLSMDNPSWGISDVEIQAYWPEDISEAVSNLSDDMPIWYYSGYHEGNTEDYCKTRNFYLSEPAEMQDNIITIKGEDMSHKMEDAPNTVIQRLDSYAKSGWNVLYNWFVNVIKNTGVRPISVQSAPAVSGTSNTGYSMVMLEQSPREHVQNVINLAHYGSFWPTFVDAGIPAIYWSKPTKKWDIYEKDCGNVVRAAGRNIAKISSDDDYGIHSTATRSGTWSKLAEDMKIAKGKTIIKNFDEYYWAYKVNYQQGNKFLYALLNSVSWIPNKTSVQKLVKTKEKYKSGKNKGKYKKVKKWFYRPTLYGKSLKIAKESTSIIASDSRPGTTIQINPSCYGKIYQGTTWIFPNYYRLFERSNICGSFTFKGDPRMQPRDIFDFHRKDKDENGNEIVETCTIENITLKHEGGGTQADITYRKGVC